LKRESKAKERSQQAVELLGSAIDIKISELTESNRQLKRKIFDLYTIFEISRNINSVLDYETLVDSFLLTSLGQVGASSAALYLPQNGENERLVLAVSKGITDESRVRGEIDLKGSLSDYLQSAAKPLPVSEISERFSDLPEFSLLRLFPNGLVIPLIMQGELKGILILARKVSGVGFTPDDIEFLSIMANQFVVALENARLYESEKKALHDLKIAQQQLVLTERQAAIGELSAKIAHEINNPLSIISNYLHLCGRNLGQPEKAGKHLDVVRQELSRIARIVRQLLDFNRPQKTEKAEIDLRELLDNILNLMEWQLSDKKIEVECRIDDDLPRVIGSAEQLKQVFLNLIINARDFMPDGGKLRIGLTNSDSNLKMTFADTGPGIPEENRQRIFEPFFTTKQDSAGTGLGLSVCFGIVKEHGGQITARNDSGGACFEIILPAVSDSGEES